MPLSSVVSFESTVEPSKRTQFQQLNSVTVEGVMANGITLGEAVNYLEEQARAQFPRGFTWDYIGQSRQYAQQGSSLIVTFFMSLLIIYLVLAAQFESWRDPIIILVSVPMSIAGALAFLTLGVATVNIYTQVGLITLIGLIAKNGILIVEFANQLQLNEGLSKREAVIKAAAIRLATHPHDHGIDDHGHGATADRHRTRRRESLSHRPGGSQRAWHRNIVHLVCGAGRLLAACP